MDDRPFLIGAKLNLHAMTSDDISSDYVGWFNDAEVCEGNSHHVFPYTKSQAHQFLAGDSANVPKCLLLKIMIAENSKHIGNIALQNINYINRSAELAIVLGDKQSWGKGYGVEAAKLIIQHGLLSLNLTRIHCGTHETNLGMCRLASRLGMKKVGTLRNAAFKNGQYRNIVLYDILAEEWMSDSRFPPASH